MINPPRTIGSVLNVKAIEPNVLFLDVEKEFKLPLFSRPFKSLPFFLEGSQKCIPICLTSLASYNIFSRGHATLKATFRSVGWLVGRSVGQSVRHKVEVEVFRSCPLVRD